MIIWISLSCKDVEITSVIRLTVCQSLQVSPTSTYLALNNATIDLCWLNEIPNNDSVYTEIGKYSLIRYIQWIFRQFLKFHKYFVYWVNLSFRILHNWCISAKIKNFIFSTIKSWESPGSFFKLAGPLCAKESF